MKLQDAILFCMTQYKIILRNLSHDPLFTHDRNSHRGRILLFCKRGYTPSQKNQHNNQQGIFVELNLRKKN